MHSNSRLCDRGFTLAELIVASTLITLVMGTVYTAFHTSIHYWRLSRQDLETRQNARTAMGLITRDLQSIAAGSGYLFQGNRDRIEFFAVSEPMNLAEGQGPRVLAIRYRTRPDRRGLTLLREEAVVLSGFPLPQPAQEDAEPPRIKTGRWRTFEIAPGIKKLEIRYYWEELPHFDRYGVYWVEPVVETVNKRGWDVPQAVQVALTLEDSDAPTGQTTFTGFTVVRGPTGNLDTHRPRREGA